MMTQKKPSALPVSVARDVWDALSAEQAREMNAYLDDRLPAGACVAGKPSAAPVADLSAYQWLTTAQNPRSRPTGYDAGQRGWSTHAVIATPSAKFSELRTISSLCGLLPAHGWGMDMFIERQCRRCLRKLGFACLTCRGSGYRRTSVTHYEDCPDCKGTGKSPAGREAARHAR
jgi:hypothetical protein